MTEEVHQPCPYTSCGSSDAFSWNDEGYGYCHSCGQGYPAKKKQQTYDWAKETYPLSTTRTEPPTIVSTTYKNVRGLDEDVAKLYGIQGQLDADNNLAQIALKWPNNIQYRRYWEGYDGPKYSYKFKGKDNQELFGPDFNSGSSKRIYITEGGIDAASLFQVLGKTYPVKAIPTSSINKKFLERHHTEFNAYDQIVYAGELDKAGRKAADLFYQAYPHKLHYVSMTKFKDANEFIINKDPDSLMWSARKPQRYTPENFFIGEAEREKTLREQNPYETSEVGHQGLDGITRGMVRGGVTFVKAERGTGKTEFFRFLQRGLLKNNKDIKLGLVHMEEMRATTYRCMATYILGKNVRTEQDQEENGVSIEDIISAANEFCRGEADEDRVLTFELLPTDEPINIVEYCRLAATVYGVDFIFIDHIQRLIYRNGAADGTGQLTQVGTQLAELAKELNIGIIAISHINKDGDTQYAKALENEAIICIDVKRDVDNEDELLRNISEFHVSKNRPFARLGSAGKVLYNTTTTILTEYILEV